MIEILVITISNPLLIGIYEDESNYEIIDLEEASEQAVVFEMAYSKVES